MNWEQLRAILWLRARLSTNQWRKAGVFNFVVMMILVISLLVLAGISFFLAIGLGISLLPRATPTIVMAVWDIMIVALLFSWTISLLVEVQRMELLSIEKLLHLPVSLRDAFILNYLSSIVSLNTLCFVPAALGLCFALAYTHGVQLLWLIPILLSFILMLTAVTYQFRGWLSSLMSNKRRQRSVIMLITISFVGLAQVPNAVIQLTLPDDKVRQKQVAEQQAELTAVANALSRQEISQQEHDQRKADLRAAAEQAKAVRDAKWQANFERTLTTVNQVLPIGWMPYASKQLITGPMWPAGLSGLAMTLIGSLSLWRAYASTIRFYTGKSSASKAQSVITPGTPKSQSTSESKASFATKSKSELRTSLVERSLPIFSQRTSAIAFCSLQNLVRAPEAKMTLIGPGILAVMFILMIVSDRTPKIMPGFEPLVWLAGLSVLTFMCMMLMMNVFGMDRNGFRCFVLMPVQRREILLGKNLSLLPILLFISILISLGLYFIAPVDPITLMGNGCQLTIAFLFACLAGNWSSIYFPIAMNPGTGKPVQVNLLTMVVQMLVILSCPLFIAPGLAFYAAEWGAKYYFKLPFFPLYTVLSAIEVWFAFAIYRYVLIRQGTMLQKRETKILEVLTVSTE